MYKTLGLYLLSTEMYRSGVNLGSVTILFPNLIEWVEHTVKP